MLTLLPPTEDPNWIPVRSLTRQQGVSPRDLGCIELASLSLRRSLLLDAQTLRLLPRPARQWWSDRTSGGEPFLRGLLPEVFTLREVENTLATVLIRGNDPCRWTGQATTQYLPMDRRNFRRTWNRWTGWNVAEIVRAPTGYELWRFSAKSEAKS